MSEFILEVKLEDDNYCTGCRMLKQFHCSILTDPLWSVQVVRDAENGDIQQIKTYRSVNCPLKPVVDR